MVRSTRKLVTSGRASAPGKTGTGWIGRERRGRERGRERETICLLPSFASPRSLAGPAGRPSSCQGSSRHRNWLRHPSRANASTPRIPPSPACSLNKTSQAYYRLASAAHICFVNERANKGLVRLHLPTQDAWEGSSGNKIGAAVASPAHPLPLPSTLLVASSLLPTRLRQAPSTTKTHGYSSHLAPLVNLKVVSSSPRSGLLPYSFPWYTWSSPRCSVGASPLRADWLTQPA